MLDTFLHELAIRLAIVKRRQGISMDLLINFNYGIGNLAPTSP